MYTAARKVIFTAAQTLICRICARAARQAQEPVRMPLATFRPLVGEPRAARRRTGAHPGLVKIPPCLCKLHRQARINDSARDSDQMSGSLAACSGAIAGAQARTTRRSQARTNRRAGQHPRRRAVECAGAHGSAASPIPPTLRAGGWGGGGLYAAFDSVCCAGHVRPGADPGRCFSTYLIVVGPHLSSGCIGLHHFLFRCTCIIRVCAN